MTPKQKEFVTQWIAALRSGEYTALQGKLRKDDMSNEMCCLGVLCHLKNPKRWFIDDMHDVRYRDTKKNPVTGQAFGWWGEPPPDVQKAAGLVENEGRFIYDNLPAKIRTRLIKAGYTKNVATEAKGNGKEGYGYLTTLNDFYVRVGKKPFPIIADILEWGMDHPELDLFVFNGVNEYAA